MGNLTETGNRVRLPCLGAQVFLRYANERNPCIMHGSSSSSSHPGSLLGFSRGSLLCVFQGFQTPPREIDGSPRKASRLGVGGVGGVGGLGSLASEFTSRCPKLSNRHAPRKQHTQNIWQRILVSTCWDLRKSNFGQEMMPNGQLALLGWGVRFVFV